MHFDETNKIKEKQKMSKTKMNEMETKQSDNKPMVVDDSFKN